MTIKIVSAVRTSITSFGKGLSAPELAAKCIQKSELIPQEVILGNVLSAGIGQSPARQAVILAKLPNSVEATTINKVCASGMKAVMIAAQSIAQNMNETVIAGGMESMSNVPFLVPRNIRLGHQVLKDGLIHDGLWDPYNNIHMGSIAELCAKKMKISRQQLDEYAKISYQRAIFATKEGWFENEIIDGKKDEEINNVNFERIPTLKPAFQKDGVITAANSSKLSDGAATLTLTSKNVPAIAEILSFADAACDPLDFPIAPSLAIPIALKRANLSTSEVNLWEINEAFAAVAIANISILKLNPEIVNVAGGAIALGHPIGCSGARIIVTLIHRLKKGQIGCAAICNGGGGSSAIVIRKIN